MKWEFLGKQALVETNKRGKGYVYSMSVWRTPVPGGWLIKTLNSNSNSPDPALTFYPDAEHCWIGNPPPEAEYLLRPAKELPPGTEKAVTDDEASKRQKRLGSGK